MILKLKIKQHYQWILKWMNQNYFQLNLLNVLLKIKIN